MIDGFDSAIAEIRAVVGTAHVLTDASDVEAYSRDISPWKRVCSAVVYPGTAAEVAQVVRIAAVHRLPVWPFSKGKNWGYGATMGFYDGALVLMLDRLNRILDVNEELAYAVIEPGVTQQQLNDYLKAKKIKLWVDCTDSTPQGSVIGNALERGVGYTPYSDHFGHLCGMEVVLANGEIVRTGGGPANSRTWHTHKWGTGPYIEGLFSQSNLGIVTRAGVWLMPEPDEMNCFVCEVARADELPAVFDSLRRLALTGATRANFHLANDVLVLAQMIQYPYDLLDGQTYLSPAARADLRDRYQLTPWIVNGGIYGTADQVRVGRDLVRKELSRYGNLMILDDWKVATMRVIARGWMLARGVPLLGSMSDRVLRRFFGSPEKLGVLPHVYPILKGIPGEHILGFAYFKSRRERPRTNLDPARDGAGMIWLAVTCPMTGRDSHDLLSLSEPIFHRHGFDLSAGFIMVNPRSCVCLFEIFYDRSNADETARAQALYDDLAAATVTAGFQQYRTSVAYSEKILRTATEFQTFVDALKTAADPNDVIAPGRYGIGLPNS